MLARVDAHSHPRTSRHPVADRRRRNSDTLPAQVRESESGLVSGSNYSARHRPHRRMRRAIAHRQAQARFAGTDGVRSHSCRSASASEYVTAQPDFVGGCVVLRAEEESEVKSGGERGSNSVRQHVDCQWAVPIPSGSSRPGGTTLSMQLRSVFGGEKTSSGSQAIDSTTRRQRCSLPPNSIHTTKGSLNTCPGIATHFSSTYPTDGCYGTGPCSQRLRRRE